MTKACDKFSNRTEADAWLVNHCGNCDNAVIDDDGNGQCEIYCAILTGVPDDIEIPEETPCPHKHVSDRKEQAND